MERFSLKLRNDIGLSRKYIAKMAGVSEATVMHYEKGDNVAMESDIKLRKVYKTARNLYSRRNREAYMEYIRNYLDTNKIGIVEFSKMVQTGSDIYRDPKLKSRVLATADQIIKIEKATGINYKEYIDRWFYGVPKKTDAPEQIDIIEESTPVDDPLQHVAAIPSDILGRTEVTVDGDTKHVECTTIGYSAECVGIDHVIYKKKIKRVITEVIEVAISADEFAKIMKGETA